MLKAKYPSYPYIEKYVKLYELLFHYCISKIGDHKFLGIEYICVMLGVAVELETTTRTAWIAAKLSNWGSLH